MTPFRQGARLVACALLLSAAVAGCARAPSAHGPVAHAVHMHALQFQPDTTTATVGDTMVWTNDDIVPHTATQDGNAWDTGQIQPHASARVVLARAGDAPFHCTVHPTMRGVVIVRGAP